jgi:uncharacterized protein (AIM24 family)
LKGSSDIRVAEELFYANQTNIHLKMVHIALNNSHVRIEPGALYFMKGQLEIKASAGGGIMQGLARKMASGESFFVNEIHGTGDIYLEPTFGHFFLHQINKEEGGVIIDKSLFYGGTAGLDISAVMQKNISSALFGGEGLFQTLISGTGIAILCSPVPADEIVRYELGSEKLSVDGNFALMRSEKVNFRAEKSSKNWRLPLYQAKDCCKPSRAEAMSGLPHAGSLRAVAQAGWVARSGWSNRKHGYNHKE